MNHKLANNETFNITKGNSTTDVLDLLEKLSPLIPYVDTLTDDTPDEEKYLTFEALEDTTFSIVFESGKYDMTQEMRESFSYSTDNGQTWTTFTTPSNGYSGTALTTPTIHKGGKVLWKGIGSGNYSGGAYCHFTSTGEFNVNGNIMSLLYGDDFIGETSLAHTERMFHRLFENCKIINAENLILSATTLAYYCYNGMFYHCNLLSSAPKLPATTLVEYCYSEMFRGCMSLTKAPNLPATTLANSCYHSMFRECGLLVAPTLPATTLAQSCYISMFTDCPLLVKAPQLPATTLENQCYDRMFSGCTALVKAPDLDATTLVYYCYNGMFEGCQNLNYIKARFTTTPSNTYTSDWVKGVATIGTFYKNVSATWNVTGTNAIPSGWTVVSVS